MSSTNEAEVELSSFFNLQNKQDATAKSSTKTLINEKSFQMMVKMGYKSGCGLGKSDQGNTHPIQIQAQFNKNGLGLSHPITFNRENWDLEDVNVNEEIKWFKNENTSINCKEFIKFLRKGPPITQINNETHFIESKLLEEIIEAKKIFEVFNPIELAKARTRANPFETIRYAFFMNRAALKMANIDAITNFMFTNIDYDPIHRKKNGVYYFADVCAGPGGFSEYVLWRKKWSFKGFGFTLKGEHDFRLCDSTCASGTTFQSYYGLKNDGNVCNPDNISDFAEKVKHQTGGLGVHFMMADGGFSVEGNENLQEVLSKQIYVCQCLVALDIVRTNGHFVTKLFDLFTPFSVGLIYLMSKCFEKVAIFKPNASRPANSERYLICKNFSGPARTREIKTYLKKIVDELWIIKESQNKVDDDIIEIVPLNVLKGDLMFYNYIFESNNKLGEKQKNGLLKLGKYCRNPLLIDPRQELLRSQCLNYWKIPDKSRLPSQKFNIDDLLSASVSRCEFLLVQPREINNVINFRHIISDPNEWHFVSLSSTKCFNSCNFYAGLGGGRAIKLQGNKWIKAKNLKLCKGTLLYGELVKEQCTSTISKEETDRKSLHIIDALRLGDTSLVDLPFKERLDCIQTYCEAVNFESVQNKIRIRPKMIKSLNMLDFNSISYNFYKKQYFLTLPTLGLQSVEEYYYVSSLLLLKTDEHQSFDSTYVLRVQVYINDDFVSDAQPENYVKLDDIINYIKIKC